MKKSILTVLITSLSLVTLAQEFRLKPTGNLSDLRVVVKNLNSDLVIEGTTGSELVFNTNDYEGIPEKAKGLKPLSATGPENTGIGLSVVQEGNEISVSAASREADESEYILGLPKSLKLTVDIQSFQGGDIVVKGMSNEVEIRSQVGDIHLLDVTGPVVAHSLSSDIRVVYSTVNQSAPTSISSTSGEIDVTMPATTKASLELSSMSGEIYTDLDLAFEGKDGMTRMGGTHAKSTLNGGGVKMSINAISGNIYLRKK